MRHEIDDMLKTAKWCSLSMKVMHVLQHNQNSPNTALNRVIYLASLLQDAFSKLLHHGTVVGGVITCHIADLGNPKT